MADRYVRVIYEYKSESPEDLALSVGDTVKVTEQIDKNWMHGSCRGKSGTFPSNFVKDVTIPVLRDGERVFAALGNFPGQQTGDLNFAKGDIVIGISPVDHNWWNGCVDGRIGIFPLTHVVELSINASNQNSLVEVIAKVKAVANLTAQLDDELSLTIGDIIDVLSIAEDGFAVGRCNNKTGQFPLSFVKVISGNISAKPPATQTIHANFHWWKKPLEPQLSPNAQDPDEKSTMFGHSNELGATGTTFKNGQSLNQENTSEIVENSKVHNSGCYINADTGTVDPAGITPYARTLYPFTASQDSELSFKENETVKLIRHVDSWTEGELDGCRGYFPTSYIDIIVDCGNEIPPESSDISALNDSKHRLESGDTYARVLYDFKSSSGNDLDLKEGDTVTVLRRVDANWLEACHDDGRIGLCPVSYIELFGCELSNSTISSSSANTGCAAETNTMCESRSSIITTSTANISANTTTVHTNRSTSLQTASTISSSKPSLRPVVKPKPTRSPEHRIPASGGLLDGESLRTASSGTKPLVPARPSACDRGVSLDEMVRRQLSSAGSSKTDLTLLNTTATLGPASTLPRNFVTGLSTRGDTASTVSSSTGSRFSMLTLSDNPTSNSSAAFSSSSQDFDVDWLMNREMSRSSKSYESNTQGVNIVNGSHTAGVREGRKKPAPPRPSVPVPPSARSRSDWQKFEDEQLSIYDLEQSLQDSGESRVSKGRHISNSSNLIKFSPMTESSVQSGMKMESEYCYMAGDSIYETISHPVAPTRTSRAVNHNSNNSIGISARLTSQQLKNASQSATEDSTAERKQKSRETRGKNIAELISTERNYVESLELCLRAFAQTDGCPETLDLDLLLGNCADVMEVSHAILGQLKIDVEEKAYDQQLVGRCFVVQKEEILKVYALYCQNYDSAITLLNKYETQPEMMEFLERVMTTMRQKSSVFDIGSVLIKPVQRVSQYPLLLRELDKNTEDDHVDKAHLSSALAAMSDVATSVNEYKRRKELVMKYKQETDKTIGDKIGRLTVRSTKKKFLRMSQWIIGTQTVDENFNREEGKFRAIDGAVRGLARDISQYLEHFYESVSCEESVAVIVTDYYAEQSSECEADKFCSVHHKIVSKLFSEFKCSIESEILPPLNSLMLMFQGPHKVIRKRHDKLLDYDNVSARLKNATDQEQVQNEDEELQIVKKTYEALNAQLLDDLPRLFSLSLSIINSCLVHFAQLQRLLYTRVHDEMLNLLGLKMISSSSSSVSPNIIETFNISHTAAVDELSALSFIPPSFNPLAAEVRKFHERRSSSLSSQEEHDLDISNQSANQLAALRQRYPSHRLYLVNKNYTGSATMDLILRAGTLVGIIKEGDPMGNKNKWFIDDGESKGFILKDHLTQQSAAAAAVAAMGCGDYSSGYVKDLLGPLDTPLTPMPAGLSSISHGTSFRYLSFISEPFCQARFAFTGRNELELSIREAEVLKVIQWCDLDGDPEWWRVENSEGRSGYAPSSHLFNYCQARFAYTGRNELELSIKEGEVLKVIQKYDPDGNPKWWLVENFEGRSGYAPSSHLYRMM